MIKLTTRLFAAFLFIAPFTVSAAQVSNCKGLSETLCGEANACSWVGSYTRKDGRVVKGYCRVRSGKTRGGAGIGGTSRDVSLLDQPQSER